MSCTSWDFVQVITCTKSFSNCVQVITCTDIMLLKSLTCTTYFRPIHFFMVFKLEAATHFIITVNQCSVDVIIIALQ